jgi:hypothetical protein
MFKNIFNRINFKNIGSKIRTGFNIGKKIFKEIIPLAFGKIKETIQTSKSISDPIEKHAFKEQVSDVIGKIPTKLILNPITEFLVPERNEFDFENWED